MFPTFDMLGAYVTLGFVHDQSTILICRSAGIVPSNKTTYSLTNIQEALTAQTGALPYLGCGGNGTVLQEVWYFNHVSGTVSWDVVFCWPPCDPCPQTGAIRSFQGSQHDDDIILLDDCRNSLLRAHAYVGARCSFLNDAHSSCSYGHLVIEGDIVLHMLVREGLCAQTYKIARMPHIGCGTVVVGVY
jgi:hypothetical protein